MKVLPPNNRPVHEVSNDLGISVRTIYKWMKMVKDGSLNVDSTEENAVAYKTDLEKFTLVLESKRIGEDALGEWLRKNGLHTEHLQVWEQELAEKMTAKEQKYREENQGLKKELNETKRELHKKEKALAELAALYTLKKKANAIWGEKEDD
jgi:transposase-like protein